MYGQEREIYEYYLKQENKNIKVKNDKYFDTYKNIMLRKEPFIKIEKPKVIIRND